MKNILYFLLSVLLFASCSKTLTVTEPDFDVALSDTTTLKAGQPVWFDITGNAYSISFYSGEVLKDYEYRAGRVIDVSKGGATIQFQSAIATGVQANQLKILVSTDYNGDTTINALNAATWTDITNKFTLGTGATFVSSGTPYDITSLFVPGKPLYFAFKYNTRPQAVNGLVRQFQIQSFFVRSKTDSINNAPVVIYDQSLMGFRIIDSLKNEAPTRSSATISRLTLYGNEWLFASMDRYNPALNPLLDKNNPVFDPNSPSYDPTKKWQPPFDPQSPYNDPSGVTWAVSRPITLSSVTVGADWSTAIKSGIATSPIKSYNYTYSKPGTYTAVFLATNSSVDESHQVVKKITFTIAP